MTSPCVILMNNRAGLLLPRAGEEQLRAVARDVEVDVEVISTDSPEEMRRRLRDLVRSGVPKVAVSGGDGTVSLAAQELAHTGTALGIIAQGTANNFATALRLPMDLPSALRVLADGVVRAVDLGKANERYFTEAAGVGLFADALALYGKGSTRNVWRGLVTMLKLVFSLQARRLTIRADDETVVERAVMTEVSNSYRMAHSIPVAPTAKLTDGLLDLVILGDLRRAEILPYYRAFRSQLHLNLPKVSHRRVRRVEISARRRMNVHADDTVIGVTPVTIEVQPGALKVLVDRL